LENDSSHRTEILSLKKEGDPMYERAGYDPEPPEEPKPVYECEYCGCGFHEGDGYFKIDGEILCDKCLMDSPYRKIV